MVYPKIIGQFTVFSRFKGGKLTYNQFLEIDFEIAEEQLVIAAGQQFENIVIVLFYMLEQMQEYRAWCIAIKNMLV